MPRKSPRRYVEHGEASFGSLDGAVLKILVEASRLHVAGAIDFTGPAAALLADVERRVAHHANDTLTKIGSRIIVEGDIRAFRTYVEVIVLFRDVRDGVCPESEVPHEMTSILRMNDFVADPKALQGIRQRNGEAKDPSWSAYIKAMRGPEGAAADAVGRLVDCKHKTLKAFRAALKKEPSLLKLVEADPLKAIGMRQKPHVLRYVFDLLGVPRDQAERITMDMWPDAEPRPSASTPVAFAPSKESKLASVSSYPMPPPFTAKPGGTKT